MVRAILPDVYKIVYNSEQLSGQASRQLPCKRSCEKLCGSSPALPCRIDLESYTEYSDESKRELQADEMPSRIS